MRTSAAAMMIVLALTIALSAAGQSGREPMTAGAIFSLVKDSVVTIKTPSGQGSGIVLGSSGLVVTNLHVVVGDGSATVRLPNGDDLDVVSVVGVDERRDLVLLRIAGFDLKTANLGNSDSVSVGDRVAAIGSPSGLELSLSDGIVSAVRDSGEGYRVIQTTAAISAGSSGGGLFNTNGELIAITTFKIRGAENINFAVPINYVRGLTAVPEHAESLAEMNVRLARSSGAAAVTAERSGGSTQRLRPPRLEVTYRHAQGAQILIRQRDDTATVTFYRANYSIYGHGLVKWHEDRKGFVGTAEMPYVCGSVDTRITTIKSGLELFVTSGGTLTMRYQVPSGINCSRDRVATFNWGEDTWYPQ